LRKCNFCKKIVHLKRDCYKLKTIEKKSKKEDRNYKKDNNNGKWNDGSYKMANINSINRNLFTLTRKKSYAEAVKTESPKIACAIDSTCGQEFVDHLEEYVSYWKDDSGATDHCCKNKILFSSMQKCNAKLATAGESDIIHADY